MAWWILLKQYYSFLVEHDLRLGFNRGYFHSPDLGRYPFMTDPTTDLPIQTVSNADNFSLNAIWLGLAGVIFGLLPVIIANRFVSFRAYSHYALPASLAAVILIGGVINLVPPKKLQIILVSLLVGTAALTHYALAINVANEQATVRDFWWQVYWRTPKIQEGTLLAAYYPSINHGEGYGEDIEIVSGPANFLYYPQPQSGIDLVKYKLGATLFDKQGIQNILDEKEKKAKGIAVIPCS